MWCVLERDNEIDAEVTSPSSNDNSETNDGPDNDSDAELKSDGNVDADGGNLNRDIDLCVLNWQSCLDIKELLSTVMEFQHFVYS